MIFNKLGFKFKDMPLYDYKDKSFYFMKTDAFDRFATKIEKRFTKKEILEMMQNAGLKDIRFSESEPFWVCIGYKR